MKYAIHVKGDLNNYKGFHHSQVSSPKPNKVNKVAYGIQQRYVCTVRALGEGEEWRSALSPTIYGTKAIGSELIW